MRNKVTEEIGRPLVRPVVVLQDQDGGAEGGEDLNHSPEDPVALGSPVTDRLGSRGQCIGQLGEQGAQGTRHGTERAAPQIPFARSQGIQHGSQGERLADRVAVSDQPSEHPQLLQTEQLVDQACLPYAGRTANRDDGGGVLSHSSESRQFLVSTDEHGGYELR